jgi:hypothetical protein
MGRPKKISSEQPTVDMAVTVPEPKHSADTVHCLSCKYFDVGRCHRCPPFVANVAWSFPVVNSNDWCGEWVKK